MTIDEPIDRPFKLTYWVSDWVKMIHVNTIRNVIYILLMLVVLASWSCTEARVQERNDDKIIEPAVPVWHMSNQPSNTRKEVLVQEDYLWYPISSPAPSCTIGSFRLQQSPPEPLLFYPDHHHFSMDSVMLD